MDLVLGALLIYATLPISGCLDCVDGRGGVSGSLLARLWAQRILEPCEGRTARDTLPYLLGMALMRTPSLAGPWEEER